MITVAMSRVRWHSVVLGMVHKGQGSCETVASVAGALGWDGPVLRFSYRHRVEDTVNRSEERVLYPM